MPSNFLAFDRIRAFTRQHKIYQAERVYQDQSALDRLTAGGEFLDFNAQAAILDQTNLQINRLERYKDYEQMDQTGEVSLALDLYADEGSLVDPERKHTLIIRARNKRLKAELEDLMFDTLLWDTYCRPAIRYLCKYGDLPFEVIPSENRDCVSSLRFMNVYNFTRIETRYGDLVGFFYQDAMNPLPQFMHPWQVMHLRLTNFENIYHPYGRCQNFGTRLSTPDGYKNIEDFQEGDKVYVFDGREIVESRVLAACHSGRKQILRIKTRHCANECSENHPVMVRQWIKRPFKFGEKWFSELVYKRADELRIGDELVIPRLKTLGEKIELPEVSTLTHNGDNLTNIHADHLSSSQHRLMIPRYVNEDFASLFGFLTGDGWLKQANGSINGVDFALGEDENTNSKYESLLRSYGLNPIRRKNTASQSKLPHDICESASIDFGHLLAEMGFCSGFDKKRVPKWIYRTSLDVQEAFIKGLVESDGSSNVDKWDCERLQLELSNYELIKDVKALLHQMGWKCGNILERHRDSKTTVIHEQEFERSDSWIIYFYKSDLFESAGKHVQRESGSRGYNARKKESEKYGDDVVFEPIIAIEDGGEQETADIQVDHPASNFIADGVVVHNSILDGGRKAFKQLRLMEDAALIYRITRAPEKRKFTVPVGLIPPKEVPEYMQMIARNFKRQRFYNPATGTFDERYSPLIQEDDFFLPRRPDGSGPDVDTLPGAENLDQIADIEYFKKKMIAPMKIPFERVGIGESGGAASEKSLSQSHAEFAKAVQWVQREVATGLTKVAIIHLALRGYSVEDLKGFDIALSATSAMEELYRIETWQTRAAVMAELKDLGWFPKEWIVTRFTDLSPDEIEELKDMEETESQGGPGGGIPGGGLDLEPGLEPGAEAVENPLPGEEGAEGGEEGLPEEEAAAAPLEGYDYAREQRLLMELHKQGKRKEALNIIRTWAHRLGRDTEPQEYNPLSGFTYLLETKELDGLSSSKPNVGELNGKPAHYYNPNKDTGLLVEWSVPDDLRDEAIKEVYDVLTLGGVAQPSEESDEITEEDLPVTRVSAL